VRRVFLSVGIVCTLGAIAIAIGVATGLSVDFSVTHVGSGKGGGTKAVPHEFLYLDVNRVGAYLAQLDGGTDVKEHIGEKVVQKANGEAVLASAFKAGASVENENFVEREVTPTAASSFERLKEKLGKLDDWLTDDLSEELADAASGDEAKGEAEQPQEGEFVQLREEVHVPAYLNLYRTVHHAATMAAMYPAMGNRRAQRKAAHRQRRAAREFEEQVGRNPRMTLALKPKKGITLLLPARFRQLNEEQSLLTSGGKFTIIGKVVRIFKPGDATSLYPGIPYAYVDTLTRELWKQPLAHAPKGLICRAIPECMTAVEEIRGAPPTRRRKLAGYVHARLGKDRRKLLRELRKGTEIRCVGAVILPIAIYR
jgi:hypothetical protein